MSLLRAPLWRPFQRIAKDARGVSAVEFALILPLMLTIYLGGNELSHALTIARKVTHVTSTLGDLVTQSKVVTATDLDGIMDAATSVMEPYGTTELRIILSGIRIDAAGNAWVAWSHAFQDAPLVTDAPFNDLPAGITVPSTFIVTAEVHYNYTPVIGYTFTGDFDLKDNFYLRPRFSPEVTFQ